MRHVTLTHIPAGAQWRICPICNGVHHAATIEGVDRAIDQCRRNYIAPIIKREAIQSIRRSQAVREVPAGEAAK